MTHLCHKPVGGGGQRFRSAAAAVQQPICRTLGVVSFEPSTEGLRAPQFRQFCPEEADARNQAARIHRWARRLGGSAAWPLAARGQQGNRVRRIGVLMPLDENDPQAKSVLSAFTQAVAGFGWTDGRNVRMDLRWYGENINRIPVLAHELVGLQPDIILANGTPKTVALQRETR